MIEEHSYRFLGVCDTHNRYMDNSEIPAEARAAFQRAIEGEDYIMRNGQVYIPVCAIQDLLVSMAVLTVAREGATPVTAVAMAAFEMVREGLKLIESEMLLKQANDILDTPPEV